MFNEVKVEKVVDDGTSLTSPHYNTFALEDQPIVKMMRRVPSDVFLGHLECTFLKYNLRNGTKANTNDTNKAVQYASWYFEFMRRTGITVAGQFVRR